MSDLVEIAPTVLKRILVATDFSPAARLAVWRAGQLAKLNDAHLHVVHAQPDWNLFARSAPRVAEHYHAVVEHAERALREELAFLEATFGIHVRGETRTGPASRVLHAAAQQIEPHLIVAGARGEHDTPAMAPFLGGTALKLVTSASSPVLIVRTPGVGAYSVAVAAVESSHAPARLLLRWAGLLLGEGECDCHVVHAFDVPYVARMRKHGVSESVIQASSEQIRKAAMSVMDEVLRAEAGLKRRFHVHLVSGETVGTLLAEIERRKPDLVVVGRHGHSPREHPVASFGSVALRIAYHVPGDVLVVP